MLEFQFGTPVPACLAPGIGIGAIITFSNPLPTGAGTFTIDGVGSNAYVCASQNDCASATGTLVLDALDSVATGSYTLTRKDGIRAAASFSNIVVCAAATCG